MQAYRPDQNGIVFVHLPKCAGTATTNAIRRAMSPKSEYIGLSISTFGCFEEFDTISDACRNTIVWNADDLPSGPEFVYGHLQFQFTRKAYPAHRFLLLMREPRSRLVSHWLYWRSNSDEALAPWGTWGEWIKSSRQDFDEFVSDRRAFCQTDNVAARLLLQPHPAIREGQLIDESEFGKIKVSLKEALDSIHFVGFTEDQNLSQKLETFIGQPLKFERDNATTIRSADRNLDVRDQVQRIDPAMFERMTYLDKFVWEYALARSNFSGDIEDFRNRCFDRTLNGYHAPT